MAKYIYFVKWMVLSACVYRHKSWFLIGIVHVFFWGDPFTMKLHFPARFGASRNFFHPPGSWNGSREECWWVYGCVLKWGYPNSWMVYNLEWKFLLKWMIEEYPHFRKPPYWIVNHLLGSKCYWLKHSKGPRYIAISESFVGCARCALVQALPQVLKAAVSPTVCPLS